MADGESNEREVLRERIRARLEATERSQRQLEGELGWSSGTLTRIFGGRKQLDGVMLVQLAEALGVSAASLVEGTAMASLVEVLPEAPPPEEAATEAPPDATPAPEPTADEPASEPTPRSEPAPAVPAAEAVPTSEAAPTSEPAPAAEPAPTETVRAAAPEADAEAETEANTAPEDAPTEIDRHAAGEPAPDNGAPPPEEAPAGAAGGVRGWLRSLARRVFGGSRQG